MIINLKMHKHCGFFATVNVESLPKVGDTVVINISNAVFIDQEALNLKTFVVEEVVHCFNFKGSLNFPGPPSYDVWLKDPYMRSRKEHGKEHGNGE